MSEFDDDIFSDAFFDDLVKEQNEKTDYLKNVKEGKIPFDNKNPLAIDNIMDAAKYGDFSKLQELKTVGADFNIQDKEGNTALMNAIINRQMFENPKSVVFLLQNTENFSLKNKNGENVATMALDKGCQDKLVRFILEKTDDKSIDKKVLTAALSHDGLSMDTIGVLLAKTTKHDAKETIQNISNNYKGESLTDEATYKAKLLILAGADATKFFGNTYAIVNAQFEIIQAQAQQIKNMQQQISQLQQLDSKPKNKKVPISAAFLKTIGKDR